MLLISVKFLPRADISQKAPPKRELFMSVLQVYSSQEVTFGHIVKMYWVQGFGSDALTVPPNKTLEITTLTVNFFASSVGTIGRADICGRNAAGTSMWRLQGVYAEPKKTVHLTFPAALRLEAGGYVEIGFTSEGPGTIFVEANGQLIGQLRGTVLGGEVAELLTTNTSL